MTSSARFPARFSTAMVASAVLILATCRHCSKVIAVGIVCFLFITSFAWAADETKNSETSNKKGKYSAHDYTVRLRPAAWLVFVEGEYQTKNFLNQDVAVALSGDLGYDDPYPTFSGEASFRWGKARFLDQRHGLRPIGECAHQR